MVLFYFPLAYSIMLLSCYSMHMGLIYNQIQRIHLSEQCLNSFSKFNEGIDFKTIYSEQFCMFIVLYSLEKYLSLYLVINIIKGKGLSLSCSP